MYTWAADLGGGCAGWYVAWLNIVGLIAAQAGINYSCAQFLLPFLRIAVSPLNLFMTFAAIVLTHGAINHFGVRLLAVLNDCSVVVHIAGVMVIVGAVFWFAPTQ